MRFFGEIKVFVKTDSTEEKIYPKNIILNFLSKISLGIFLKPQVQESYSAKDIINWFQSLAKSLGIKNIIRLVHDNIVIFQDPDEKEDDLPKVFEDYSLEINPDLSQYFENLYLMLEKKDSDFNYVIDLQAVKLHESSHAPIVVRVDGVSRNISSNNLSMDIFNNFLFTIEQNIRKLLPSEKIEISSVMKNAGAGDNGNSVDYSPSSETVPYTYQNDSPVAVSNDKCLFPLYGITLGKTSVKELAKMGSRAIDKDSKGKLYEYYIVNGMNFWFTEELATHIYITYTDPIPEKWRNLGFSWKHSYKKWLKILESLCTVINTIKEPETVMHFSGKHKSFEAEIMGIHKSSLGEFQITLYFAYSKGTTQKDSNTLYSIDVDV